MTYLLKILNVAIFEELLISTRKNACFEFSVQKMISCYLGNNQYLYVRHNEI